MTNVADRTFTVCPIRLRVVSAFNSIVVAAGNRYCYYTHACMQYVRDYRYANGVEIKNCYIIFYNNNNDINDTVNGRYETSVWQIYCKYIFYIDFIMGTIILKCVRGILSDSKAWFVFSLVDIGKTFLFQCLLNMSNLIDRNNV